MVKPAKLLKETDEEYIVRASKILYSGGYHISEISHKLNCDILDVYNAVVAEGRKFTTDEEYEIMMELRGKGHSYREIASEVGKSATCVRTRIIEGPVKYPKHKTEHNLTDRQINQVMKWYKDGKQIRWIASKLGITTNSVKYRLKRAGVFTDRKLTTIIVPVTDEERDKYIKMHKAGHSIKEIAIRFDRDQRTVKKHLKDFL